MPRNTTTALYTRTDNSFSNPVVGTTISPTDADTFFDDVEASMNSFIATSTSSVAIGLGAKTFTVQASKSFLVGMSVQIFSDANHANYMSGTVTSYSTTSLVVDVVVIGGSGTLADWSIFTAGARGATGKAAGYFYSWLTATTSNDPGSGNIKANNATFASITEIYLSETDADANALAAFIAAQVSGTSTIKCRFKIYDPVTPTNFMEFDATALTDNGTWDTIAVTPRSNGGSFSAALALRVDFYQKGDKGDTGATGTVNGSTGATDNAYIRADGVGGATIQAARATEDDSGKQTINFTDAGTTTVPSALKLSRATSGTAANGIGVRQEYEVENASGTMVVAAAVDVISTDVTNASEDFDVSIKAIAGGALTEVMRVLSTGVAYLANSATKIILHAAGGQTLTGGFKATPYAKGTVSTGTYTPLYSDGNFQTATNGGAHTLAPPADDCSIIIQYTNNASAGAITTSGFTKKTGDTITTTNGDDFMFYIVKIGSFSHLNVQALQ